MFKCRISSALLKYIDQIDYYDLLASSAPAEEFDIESKKISEKIRSEHSIREIAEIIVSVFNEYFGENCDVTGFLSVAEQIKNELTQ